MAIESAYQPYSTKAAQRTNLSLERQRASLAFDFEAGWVWQHLNENDLDKAREYVAKMSDNTGGSRFNEYRLTLVRQVLSEKSGETGSEMLGDYSRDTRLKKDQISRLTVMEAFVRHGDVLQAVKQVLTREPLKSSHIVLLESLLEDIKDYQFGKPNKELEQPIRDVILALAQLYQKDKRYADIESFKKNLDLIVGKPVFDQINDALDALRNKKNEMPPTAFATPAKIEDTLTWTPRGKITANGPATFFNTAATEHDLTKYQYLHTQWGATPGIAVKSDPLKTDAEVLGGLLKFSAQVATFIPINKDYTSEDYLNPQQAQFAIVNAKTKHIVGFTDNPFDVNLTSVSSGKYYLIVKNDLTHNAGMVLHNPASAVVARISWEKDLGFATLTLQADAFESWISTRNNAFSNQGATVDKLSVGASLKKDFSRQFSDTLSFSYKFMDNRLDSVMLNVNGKPDALTIDTGSQWTLGNKMTYKVNDKLMLEAAGAFEVADPQYKKQNQTRGLVSAVYKDPDAGMFRVFIGQIKSTALGTAPQYSLRGDRVIMGLDYIKEINDKMSAAFNFTNIDVSNLAPGKSNVNTGNAIESTLLYNANDHTQMGLSAYAFIPGAKNVSQSTAYGVGAFVNYENSLSQIIGHEKDVLMPTELVEQITQDERLVQVLQRYGLIRQHDAGQWIFGEESKVRAARPRHDLDADVLIDFKKAFYEAKLNALVEEMHLSGAQQQVLRVYQQFIENGLKKISSPEGGGSEKATLDLLEQLNDNFFSKIKVFFNASAGFMKFADSSWAGIQANGGAEFEQFFGAVCAQIKGAGYFNSLASSRDVIPLPSGMLSYDWDGLQQNTFRFEAYGDPFFAFVNAYWSHELTENGRLKLQVGSQVGLNYTAADNKSSYTVAGSAMKGVVVSWGDDYDGGKRTELNIPIFLAPFLPVIMPFIIHTIKNPGSYTLKENGELLTHDGKSIWRLYVPDAAQARQIKQELAPPIDALKNDGVKTIHLTEDSKALFGSDKTPVKAVLSGFLKSLSELMKNERELKLHFTQEQINRLKQLRSVYLNDSSDDKLEQETLSLSTDKLEEWAAQLDRKNPIELKYYVITYLKDILSKGASTDSTEMDARLNLAQIIERIRPVDSGTARILAELQKTGVSFRMDGDYLQETLENPQQLTGLRRFARYLLDQQKTSPVTDRLVYVFHDRFINHFISDSVDDDRYTLTIPSGLLRYAGESSKDAKEQQKLFDGAVSEVTALMAQRTAFSPAVAINTLDSTRYSLKLLQADLSADKTTGEYHLGLSDHGHYHELTLRYRADDKDNPVKLTLPGGREVSLDEIQAAHPEWYDLIFSAIQGSREVPSLLQEQLALIKP